MVILKIASHFLVLNVFCFCAVKGIYRVNGAKSRVEKLCQAFENGKHLVELSELYPHDISNVLKLYLRQVGCFKLFFKKVVFAQILKMHLHLQRKTQGG